MERGEVIQLFEAQSSTYTYIIFDPKSKEAAIIDPVLETVERDLALIKEMGLKLKYVLDTHVHADHITGAGELRRLTQAKTAISKQAKVSCCDLPLEDGEELLIGDLKIKAISTPGHTDGCMSFYFEGHVFTGDALLIRGCGRTDFQQGSSETLYHSVTQKLYKLPDDTIVYPGHDYRGFTRSTIGLEKQFNPRLNVNVSKESFIKTMAELKLAYPKKIHEALPANMACGKPQTKRYLHPQITDGMPEVTVHHVFENRKNVTLIDVRRPDEFNGEYGHIEGAKLVTLGPDLMKYLETEDKEKEIVFICRSGNRSGQATALAQQLGFKYAANMVGGMINWNLQQLPVVRD
jgi:glyoxylase-like metal-dependent hydrolase (beta-lactamase superfamily II)/rhodanese-related sulfurtransferase